MALGAGLGFAACVFFACWCIFMWLYLKQRQLVKRLMKMKFKLSDENLTAQTNSVMVDSSLESIEIYSAA